MSSRRDIRGLTRAAMWPVRRLLDPRFADVGRRIEYGRDQVVAETREVGAAQARLAENVGALGAASGEAMTFLGRELRSFESALEALADRLETLEQQLNGRLDALEQTLSAVGYSRRIDAVVTQGLEALDPDSARLVNYAESHLGFSAALGLWTNPPLTLAYGERSVTLGSVNERIVELPYAFRGLAGLEPPAAILDVGSVESTVSLSLAALGYRVTALDLRPYPFAHPNLEIAVSRLEDFEHAPGSYDAVLCISTIEHVGLGWYGEAPQEPDADRRARSRLRELLKPGGRLVLTVPYGRAKVDEVQRTYDAASLDGLLEGWDVSSREVVRQFDERTWVPAADGDPGDPAARSVAMVTATPS